MAERPALALPDKPSIAVLPFENMSGDPEQEYFADGVVEDIITALSRVRAFFVIARNSSFAYKGRVVDVRQVGRELGVRYILEGSIRKAGNIVRITGQLVEAATRTHIWADKFDGELNQIFELQDRITESVVTSIEPSVRNTEIERTRNKPPGSLTAYDLYLRAQPEFHTYTRDGFLRARELLEQALALDPNFGDAWTSLADCLGRLLLGGWLEPVGQGRRLVCESALKAVSIDPRNGPALAMAAWATAIAGDNPTRAAEFAEQALRIHPNSAYVRTMSAFGFLYNEQFDKARQNLELALRFSPMDVRSYTMYIGIANCHLFSKNFPEAIGWAERAVEKGPTFAVALRVLATALALDGRIDAARNACKNLLAAQPNASISWILQRPVGSPWMMELIVDGLRRAGLPE
jgi:adenylate cyclase